MADWSDEEGGEVVAMKVSDTWDDEVGDVPDSWDAEESKPKPVVKAAPSKVSLEEKIRQKEEKKRKDKEEKMKREEEARQTLSMTELQRERLAEEAELGLMKDTFGTSRPLEIPTHDSIDMASPVTKEDFNKLGVLLRNKLTKLEISPHYSSFAESLIRDASTGMDVEALKSASTALNALLIEKQKLAKGKSKKKAKGKLVVERENDYNYDDGAAEDEFDDFM